MGGFFVIGIVGVIFQEREKYYESDEAYHGRAKFIGLRDRFRRKKSD